MGTEGISIAGWTASAKAQGPISKYAADEIHSMLLRNDILIIECFSNLAAVIGNEKTKRAFFIFAPINFTGSEAAPVEAWLCLIPDELTSIGRLEFTSLRKYQSRRREAIDKQLKRQLTPRNRLYQ
ncbi:MAG: hypothetical protein ABSF09_10930 [Candidatus Bathyarchaeia archaeon]|jgi:hypothetical protein